MRQHKEPMFTVCFLLTGLAAGCSVTHANADPQKASIAQFIKMHWPVNVHLAPDQTMYYIELAKDGTNQLFVRAPGGSSGEVVTEFADGIGGYEVSPDGKWVAITAARGGNEQFDIYLMNAADRKIEPLFVDDETVYGGVVWKRDSSAFAYRANKQSKSDFYIYVYDLEQKSSREIVTQAGHWYPVDFRRDGSRLLVGHYVSASESYVWEYSLIGEGMRPINSLEEQWSVQGLGYGPDEGIAYAVSDYRDDRQRVIRIHISSSTVEPVLPQFNKFDVDDAEMNRERSKMAVVINRDGFGELHVFSVPDFQPLPRPDIPEGVVGNVMFEGNTLLYSLSNGNTPGTVCAWKMDQPEQPPVALTTPDTQGIDVSTFPLPRLIRYQSFDGLEIPAFLYEPPGYKRGQAIPFIVSFHGGPEGQYRPYFSSAFQYFLTRGFGVLAPNVRGSSGYGTRYLEMDNYRKRMDSVKDGVAAAQWLIDNGYSKPKMIGSYGGSYGGFMVMATITQAPKLFGAACNVVGIVNFETFLQRTKSYRRKLREAEYGPLSDSEFLKSISPIYLVDRVECPVLIAHGRNDPRVPIDEAEQLHAALKERGRNPELIVFDDEGHGFRKEPNRITFYGKLADFFEKHLTGGSPTGSDATN